MNGGLFLVITGFFSLALAVGMILFAIYKSIKDLDPQEPKKA